jgi:hypothetical protein
MICDGGSQRTWCKGLVRVVMATNGQTRPSVPSDKVQVRQIRVNAILTSDKVKPELLCPRWLPRWMAGCKLPIYCTGYRAHSCKDGTYGQGVGRARMK